jgi:hypothetical protein
MYLSGYTGWYVIKFSIKPFGSKIPWLFPSNFQNAKHGPAQQTHRGEYVGYGN